jgi:cell wall-associated NlpC family hydrolase
MKRIIIGLFIGIIQGASLYAQNSTDCQMEIVSVKNDPQAFMLHIKYGKNCEILMDHNESQITLISKAYDRNISTDSNKTASAETSGKVEKLIALAKSKIGDSYRPAQAGPDHFDCSGFVYYLFKNSSIHIPRSSLEQSKSGKKLSRKEIKRGDILFFDTHHRDHVNHSGIYLGGRKVHPLFFRKSVWRNNFRTGQRFL